MSNAADLTKDNFDASIASGISLVDFWASWCGPCRMMGPILDGVAADFAGKASVYKVNVDDEGELAQQFSISSIPALILFKDGAEVKRYIGVTQKTELTNALNAALA